MRDTEVIDYLRKRYSLSDNDIQAWTLMKADLMQMITRDRFEETGIYGLINRLKLLFQLPTMLSIFGSPSEADNGLRFTTFCDPVNVKKGTKHLKRLSVTNKSPSSAQIFDTEYVFLVTRVRKKNKGNKSKIKFEAYPDEHGCINILRALFDAKLMNLDPLFRRINAENHWIDNLPKIFPKDPFNPIQGPPSPKPRSLSSVDEGKLSNIISTINRSYREAEKSTLLKLENDTKPANIFYFVRTYEQTSKRYGKYDYQVRMVIPDEQKSAIKIFLGEIKTSIKRSPFSEWEFQGRKLKHFAARGYVNDFIQELGGEDGVESVLKILEAPYGPHTRCFVDPAFSTGFSDMRREPLHDKFGLDRIDSKNTDEYSSDLREERIRIAALFYLFSIVVPEVNEDVGKVSCFIKPLRVGPSPWLCFVTFTEFEDRDTEHYMNWQLYRHFYYDICIPQGRRIRNSLQRAYLEEIEMIVYELLGKPMSKSQLSKSLNNKFENLARYFPFQKLSVSVVQKLNEQKISVNVGNKNKRGFFICADLVRNPFYPEIMGAAFRGKEKMFEAAIIAGREKAVHVRMGG